MERKILIESLVLARTKIDQLIPETSLNDGLIEASVLLTAIIQKVAAGPVTE